MGRGATGPWVNRSCASMRHYTHAVCLDCHSPQPCNQTKLWPGLSLQIRLGHDGNVHS